MFTLASLTTPTNPRAQVKGNRHSASFRLPAVLHAFTGDRRTALREAPLWRFPVHARRLSTFLVC